MASACFFVPDETQGMRLRSHLLEYFLATSTTSSNKPLSRVVGFKPNSIKHLLSTIRSFSTASFLTYPLETEIINGHLFQLRKDGQAVVTCQQTTKNLS